MTGHDLRQKYLSFFEARGALRLPSASLVPSDPTTLLTSAGMQPLVPFFKGEEEPPARRLVSCQKCCRADDIEQVGVTWRHASFFEMLGNFSFGDYFKREAIVWAWEFLTKDLGIDPAVLWVSVYHDDLEAPEIWKKDVGLADERIYRFGKKDNWWGPVGQSGPCGPDSEIFFDRGARYDTGDPEMDRPGGDGDRYGEIWNLVFQQYNQLENGELVPLPAPGIDTGMGLERTAAILQGVDTIHHTDLFAPLINAIGAARGQGQGPLEFSLARPALTSDDPATRPTRVIADHARAATFLIADGVVPGNNGRDYMLRRFIRRAFLQGRALGLNQPFVHRLVPIIERSYGAIYPEIAERVSLIADLVRREEERFETTLGAGMGRLEDIIADAKSRGRDHIDGAEVFDLYQAQGFPPELTQELLTEAGLGFDRESFERAAQSHSKISGAGVGQYQQREFAGLDTLFTGYDSIVEEAQVLALDAKEEGARVVLDRSPFYAESGGQVGDRGVLELSDGDRIPVLDTQKQGKTWIHSLGPLPEGAPKALAPGARVQARVDPSLRHAVERAHSATHLMHAALREVLGDHVQQRGSLVRDDYLRFDFVHFGPLSPQERERVEALVNDQVLAAHPVEIREMALDEAKAAGAMALFGEKYGERVRTVRIGESFELCGGTHLRNSAAAGPVVLLSEGGVGANLRRIEALTGLAALEHLRQRAATLEVLTRELGARPDTVVSAAQKLRERARDLEKQLERLQREKSAQAADGLLEQARTIREVKVLAARVPEGLIADDAGPEPLRELVARLCDSLDGLVVLAHQSGGSVYWVVKASKSAVERGEHAGKLVKALAAMTGGKGGGRPDYAQAGGKDIARIDAALDKVRAGEFSPSGLLE